MENNKLTLTVEQTADALGIGRSLCYDSVRRGEIPSVRIGKRYLVPKAAIEKMLSGAGCTGGCRDCQDKGV